MNRLCHVRETLRANINENIDYPGIEFVLLDYNSSDGLAEWVRTDMMPYIEMGLLKYYRTTEPLYFSQSHSKNMLAQLATGDIFCLMDADNFAGLDYARWVNEAFQTNGPNTLVTTIRKTHIPFRDQGGKLAISRDFFRAARGFDESFDGYGMEDVDLTHRLEAMGGQRVFIEKPRFLKCISHSHGNRIANGFLMQNLAALYVRTPAGQHHLDVAAMIEAKLPQVVLYLLKDDTYMAVSYTYHDAQKEDHLLTLGGWKIQEAGGGTGSYQWLPAGLLLSPAGGDPVVYGHGPTDTLVTADPGATPGWKRVAPENEGLYNLLVIAYSECRNSRRLEMNLEGRHTINPQGWGAGTVSLNFDDGNPITHGNLPLAGGERPAALRLTSNA